MKNIFRKAITVLGSAALIGMTVGAAAAASYPSPFTSNTAIVVGTGAMSQDTAGAVDIAANLDARSAGTVGGNLGGTITGSSKGLASGSDLLYLNDDLSENVQTITKNDLPTVLADGTFTDDDGTDYEYEQTLTLGDSTANGFAFSNSDNDLADPALILAYSSSNGNEMYNLTATFNTAVNFTASGSEGEDITLFGKTYTIAQATDSNTLVLLGGAGNANVNVGATEQIQIGDTTYDVTLEGLSSASTTQASITVNGDTKTFTQGQSKEVGGVDVYVKTVFRTGDDGAGYAEVQLGADKITLESGNAVQLGSDADDVDGTLVTLTPSSAVGVEALTQLKISVVAPDNDVNHLLVGDSFVDPVFGTILVNFDSVDNGPEFTDEKDTGRTELEIRKGGNQELQLTLTDNADNTATIPFTYQGLLQDDNNKTIEIVEGAAIADDEYFILNSGNNQHFMQITKLDINAGLATSDIAMKDQLTGETYTFDNKNLTAGYTASILSQNYIIMADAATTVNITSSDYTDGIASGNVDVYPFLELVSGEDTRVAFTNNVTAISGMSTLAASTVTLNLPTGTLAITSNAVNDSLDIGGTGVAPGTDLGVKVGSVYYQVEVVNSTAATVNVQISVDATPGADSGVGVNTPGILFVEDEDKSETTTTTKPAIHIVTTEAALYSSVSSPVFTGTPDTETWDDTSWTGWLTNYGTYVWRDTSDTNQNFVGLSYGQDIMSAVVYIAEGQALDGDVVATDVGVKTYTDAQASSFAGMNLIVVGGSAINGIAAELLGGAYSEGDFTAQTDIAAGEFLIKSFPRDGKTALLVAGYNAADTEKAVKVLLNNVINTAEGKEYKGVSSTEAITVVN